MKLLKHALIRRRIDLPNLPLDRFKLVVAQSTAQYRDAFRLLQVGYVFQGIEPVSGRQMRISEHHVLLASTVILAYEGEQLVGTMTVTLDSPALLPLDDDYPQALSELRRSGRLAEFGSFSIVRRCWGSGVAHLLAIACAQVALRQQAEQLVIGVHPRAVDLYAALWGWRPFGAPQRHHALAAPVVGLHLPVDRLARHLTRYRPLRGGHTLHALAFGGVPLPCFALPEDLTSPLTKLDPRGFRQLFRYESDRYDTLSAKVRHQLERERADLPQISAEA